MNNGLSFLKVVNGLSRTLNIANQMIPLYKQVKPLISNSGKVLNNLKSLTVNNNSLKQNHTLPNNLHPKENINTVNLNSPTFFL